MLTSFLRHGTVVGVTTLLCSFLFMLSELDTVRYILLDPHAYELSWIFVAKHVGTMCLAFTAALLSCILIWGIVKKRHILLVPWLVFHFLLFTVLSFTAVYLTMSKRYRDFDDIIFCLAVVGVFIIVIHPIYIIYIELHTFNMLSPPRSDVKC